MSYFPHGSVNAAQVTHSDGSITAVIEWATGSTIRLQSVGVFDGSIDTLTITRVVP